MTQSQLNDMAKKASADYASKIITAPFRAQRLFGVVVEAAWQVERRFVANVRRINQLAEAFALKSPFSNVDIEEPTEPGMLEEG